MIRKSLVTLLLGSALLFGACGGHEEEAPSLPGTNTMELDVELVKTSYNGGASVSALKNSGGDTGSAFQYDHITNAVIRGGIAGVVIGVGAAPHVVAWDAARKAGYNWDPKAKLWRSETTVTIHGKTYSLEAEVVVNPFKNQNSYKMFVDGKLMTTGSSDFYLTKGTWVLYDPNHPTGAKGVEIQWDHTNPQSHTVSGLVVDASSKYLGTSAKATRAGTLYTLVVDVQPNNQNYFEITFDTASREGSILAQGYNQGLKGCWDGDYKDTPCK
jgi:hypothetical protein